MTIENKDFKVKHGLQVANGGIFGGTVQISEAQLSNEAVTKLYVDTKIDAAVQGIVFIDGGIPSTEIFDNILDGGTPGTASWEDTLDAGGILPPSDIDFKPEAPETGVDGDLYFNIESKRLSVYYNGEWITLANLSDAGITEIPQHIHDTAIDGTGLVVSTFVDSGFFSNEDGPLVSAGFFNTESWDKTYDGGIAEDNFN
jgi:hypothetical protein